MDSSTRAVVVTGVSTGIGRSIAELFLKHKIEVFGSVRNHNDADDLSARFPDLFTPLVFDVTDEQAIKDAADFVKKRLNGRGLSALVNNAGIAFGGPLIYMDMKLISRHFEVNVLGVVRVIQAFAPLLGAEEHFPHKPGKIINISSSSGKIASPFVAPYVGSKFALEGMSASLRRELLLFGIDVIVVGPGVVKTPIWKKAEEFLQYDNTPYKNILNAMKARMLKRVEKGLSSEDIAHKVYEIFTARRPRTRYAMPPNWLSDWLIPRLLPHRWLDKIFARMLGIKQPEK